MVNEYEGLSQIDSSLRKYFSSYMAPVFVNEHRKLSKEQKADWDKIKEKYKKEDEQWFKTHPNGVMSPSMHAGIASYKEKWGNETTQTFLNRVNSKFKSNKAMSEDINSITNTFYYELIRVKNGGKDSKDLYLYAKNYVLKRIHDMSLEQLARQKVPKSSLEYILSKGLSETLVADIGGFIQKGAHKAFSKKGNSDSSDLDDEVRKKAEEMYNPSKVERVAAMGVTIAGDGVTMGGFGGGKSIILSSYNWVGKKAAAAGLKGFKAGAKASAALKSTTFGVVGDVTWQGWGQYSSYKDWTNGRYLQEASKALLGDEDAAKKIEQGATKYRKTSSDFQHRLNTILNKKPKLPPMRVSEESRNTANKILLQKKGNSEKLFDGIRNTLASHHIKFKVPKYPPAWMQKLGAKQCRAMAASFYGFALEMSRKNQNWINIHGKRWTVEECAQRAVDYSKAAMLNDNFKKQLTAEKKKKTIRQAVTVETSQTTSSSTSAPGNSQSYTQQPSEAPTQQQASVQKKQDELGGWGETFDSLGINDFASTSKNLGYVLAMLPDMLIGMFTGNNPDMKLSDNYIPIASILAGVFVKNPLLRLMLMGYGGLNILNSAGHTALKQKSPTPASKVYKTYADEPLNPRLSQPVMKGRAMLVSIDGTAQTMQ